MDRDEALKKLSLPEGAYKVIRHIRNVGNRSFYELEQLGIIEMDINIGNNEFLKCYDADGNDLDIILKAKYFAKVDNEIFEDYNIPLYFYCK